jgi:DNA-binding CsgD family transcriptional regulator
MAITFIAEGKSIKDIADALGVSEIGARAVCKDARRMMRAETMPKAVRNAYQAHWLEAPIGSPGALIQSLPPTLEIGFLRNSEGSTATGPALTTQGSIEAMAITMGILQGDMHVEGGDAVATGITGVHIRTLSRMALGQDNAEIARGIDASTEHAARSVRQIQRLLGAAGRGHAVLLAFRQELIIPRIVVRAATNS